MYLLFVMKERLRVIDVVVTVVIGDKVITNCNGSDSVGGDRYCCLMFLKFSADLR